MNINRLLQRIRDSIKSLREVENCLEMKWTESDGRDLILHLIMHDGTKFEISIQANKIESKGE